MGSAVSAPSPFLWLAGCWVRLKQTQHKKGASAVCEGPSFIRLLLFDYDAAALASSFSGS